MLKTELFYVICSSKCHINKWQTNKYKNVWTPGDFGTLRSKIRFMAKDKITPEFIIQELKNIQKEKHSTCSARIGFAS